MTSRTITEAECRGRANAVLDDLRVVAPRQIDVELIAWRVGRLRIKEGDLGTARGRLFANEKQGVIRVASNLRPEGRRRFVIAHEIGHYCMQGPMAIADTERDFHTWTEGSKEAEANFFAGELLMPERLFKPRAVAPEGLTLTQIDSLATEFKTSNLAAAVHYVMHTMEACALVVSEGGKMKWFRRSASFDFFIRMGDVHKWSAAGEIQAGTSGDTCGMVSVPAGAWLDRFEPDGRESIREDSRLLASLGMIVSLLWVDEDI